MGELRSLGDLAASGWLAINDGYRTKEAELGMPGIPILRVAEVQDGNISPTFGDHVSEDYRRQFAGKTSQAGDVLVTTKGTVGRVARIGDSDPEFVYSPQLCFFRVLDKSQIDPGFLFQWFRGVEFRRQALGVQSQTDMAPYINLADMRSLQITLPPLQQQQSIAQVLGSLDHKIDSNKRIAQFSAQLCDALLTSMEVEKVPLRKVAGITMGSSPPGHTYNEDAVGLPFYQGVRDFGDRFPTRRVWCSAPVRTAETGSTLVSVRAPVGRLNRAIEECCIGRGLAGIKSHRSDALVYYALRAADAAWEPFEAEGTVFGAIKRGDLEDVGVFWPVADAKGPQEFLIEELDERAGVALAESEMLESLRNALLPALLAGRIRVPVAAEFVDAS